MVRLRSKSLMCVEVNRLVRSGVVVVIAAGNTGYGALQSMARGPVAAGMDLTINDPGNAELGITVGINSSKYAPYLWSVLFLF